MKIAFVGKGGSGKTTVSALMARYLAVHGFPVILIDADINQHLGTTLGLSEEEANSIPPLGLEISRVKEYLRGKNPRISDIGSMIKTTPPGTGSQLMSVTEANPLYEHFAKVVDGIRLLVVGPFSEEDLGIRCYHSKTGAVELLLNHLVDGAGEYVIVDMTAGADSFASGLFTRFDITFLVVEPTVKSVSVYEQYKSYAKEYGVAIKVIGNKADSADDIMFLKRNVGRDLVAVIGNSAFVKKIDRGEAQLFSKLEKRTREALRKLVEVTDSQKKNWKKFYRQAVAFHIKNARSWANEEAGRDLTAQIDPTFDLEKAVR